MPYESILLTHFGQTLQRQIPLSDYTTFRIGGPAEFLLEAETMDTIVQAFRLCAQHGIPFYFLAGGSNLLVSDEGLRGLTVIDKTRHADWKNDYTVRIESGYNLDRFVTGVSERGWGDITFAAGIPGTLGGALAGGAGAFGRLVHEYLIEATVLNRDGLTATVPVCELGIQYRTSELKKRGDIILDALMGPFVPDDSQALTQRIDRIKAERETKHPGNDLPSAGSFFKNLSPAEPGEKRIPAGKYLDEAGVKGLRIGDAGVFDKHANIIVNYGHATAAQVNELAESMARRVRERFGIELEREVQYIK